MGFYPWRACQCLLCCAVLSLCGCGSTGKTNLSSVEKAQRVKILREEADICMQRFVASQANADEGIDIEALLCFVEKRKLTAEVFPNAIDCPSCSAHYGEALRMVGVYYWTLSLKQGEQGKKAAAEQKASLAAFSKENREKANRNFKMALQQFNIHFSTGQFIPEAYWKAFEAAYLLEQYNYALQYLKGYELNNTLNATESEKLRKWRERTKKRQNKKLRDEVRQDLDD